MPPAVEKPSALEKKNYRSLLHNQLVWKEKPQTKAKQKNGTLLSCLFPARQSLSCGMEIAPT